MKNKGFTLIELLAVITILAIIALIVAPIVINLIEDSKENAQKRSLELYKAAVEQGIARYNLKNNTPLPNGDYFSANKYGTLLKYITEEPTENYEFKVSYDGNVVICDVNLNEGKVLLSDCKIDGSTVNNDIVGDVNQGEEPEKPIVIVDKQACNLETEEKDGITYHYIDSVSDLYQFSINVNSGTTYENSIILLRKNLDMSDTSNTCSQEAFTPIGSTSANNFISTFDGQGFKISNLTISGAAKQGLFGYIGVGAVVKNIEIENATIVGTDYSGVLAGGIKGAKEISNIIITGGTVTGTSAVGGLVGAIVGGTTATDYNNIAINNVTVKGNGDNVGGFAGHVKASSTQLVNIERIYATGSATGDQYVGGLIGSIEGSTEKKYINIKDAYTTSSVSSTYNYSSAPAYVGGLMGNVDYATIENTYAIGTVTYKSKHTTPYFGGLIGTAANTTVTNSYWNIETTGMTTSVGGTGKTTAEMQLQETYEGWNFYDEVNNPTGIWIMEANGYPKFK